MVQTDADRELLAAKGSVPIGIGKNTHVKRAIIDKNARIGNNVKVTSNNMFSFPNIIIIIEFKDLFSV